MEKNLSQAKNYYEKSLDEGYENAKEFLAELEKLSPSLFEKK